jgi:hypothetical protein
MSGVFAGAAQRKDRIGTRRPAKNRCLERYVVTS